MIVKVEQCWSGSSGGTWREYDGMHFRLTLPCGQRLNIGGDSWNRKVASAAKDLILIETNWRVSRQSIRFDVH